MKIAFTIGAYRLCDFVRLNIKQLQVIAPGCPVMVSDDASPESPHMQAMCHSLGVPIMQSDSRRGHFAGDMQAIVNALAFAESVKADVAIKVSQRLILLDGAADAILKRFQNPDLKFATPGKPSNARNGFGNFAVLSDLVCIRVGAIDPQGLINHYRYRITTETVPWKTFIEGFVHSLHANVFPNHSEMMPEFTDVLPSKLYLRRYQSSEDEYRKLAASFGIGGLFPMIEWGAIDGRSYRPNPVIV